MSATASKPATRHFYASQQEGSGISLWKFQTRRERDAWVEAERFRFTMSAKDIQRTFKSRGQYVRWGRPEFIR
ncbi:hypothetical protein HMPREF3289_01000 [Pseudomonas sp. HMSC75E02]|uniref:hypothetical protein n=1 Tax=Pseudomonas sp. HMSC75E02 TaxID=1608908 RepID=UPI0008A905B4|nr:hypothetical protein [Pseudomonas sp. HMSC75E02]OHS09274.1 hypothetical protein HMPREF3289_01000 [Pseudomonas sp. HMSC75E02]